MRIEDLKVLLIEDEPIGQIVVEALLQKLGVKRIDIVGTGAAAIKSAKEKTYDIYLVDLGLPDIDGFQVMQEIGKIRGKNAPMFALTGHSEPKYTAKALEAGAKRILVKPLKEEVFLEIVKEAEKLR